MTYEMKENGQVKKVELPLFVYGIFLSPYRQQAYGMSNPRYATVKGWKTQGDIIVEAVKSFFKDDCLTGLLVDVDPSMWEKLDKLEGDYDRIEITTTNDIQAYMYAEASVEPTKK